MRPKKPDELKKLQGTFRKDRSNDEKPIGTILIEAPEPPFYLSDYAQNLWTHLCTEFIKMNILQDIDTHMLEIACNEMDMYWTCQKELRKGLQRMTLSGDWKVKEEYKIAKSAFENASKILSKFGLTPSDRQKLKIIPKDDKKKLGGILSLRPKVG